MEVPPPACGQPNLMTEAVQGMKSRAEQATPAQERCSCRRMDQGGPKIVI